MEEKNKNIPANVVGLWGVIISGLGALISALSLTSSGGYSEGSLTGFHYAIPLVSDYGFKIGLTLLILGFTLQYFERTKPEGLTKADMYRVVLGGFVFYVFALYFQLLLFL